MDTLAAVYLYILCRVILLKRVGNIFTLLSAKITANAWPA